MFKKILFLAALSGAIIGSGAITTGAHAATTTPTAPSIFDLSALDDTHRDLVADAINDFDYDWAQLAPALLKKTGKTQITIKVKDLSAWNAAGLAWPSGRIHIGSHVTEERFFQQVLKHELGHIVDFFHLGPHGLRTKVARIYGAPWSVMGHNFNNGFVEVFSTTSGFDPTYPLGDDKLMELRDLLGGSDELPIKTP